MILTLPKDVQKYVLTFVAKSRDTCVMQKYIDHKFRCFLSIIEHRLTMNQYFQNMCKFIRLEKITLWRIWCVQFPSLYMYYWQEILINNRIFFNMEFKDIDHSINNNIKWMKLT